MKAKNVFLSMGLSLAMGASLAAAGLLGVARDLKPAKAAETTIYAKMEQSWWKADGAAIGIYCWGSGDPKVAWPGERMTAVSGQTDLWSFDVDIATYPNVIFTRVNGSGDVSDWGAKTKDLTFPTDGKNLFTITSSTAVCGDPGCEGEWSTFDATNKHTVHTILDNCGTSEESDVEVIDGCSIDAPSYSFGQNFSGWYSDAGYTEGNEVTSVTSDQTVYGKIENVATKSFSIDFSRNTNYSGNAGFYLYAFEENGKTNADWPGVSTPIYATGLSLPSDASLIVSNGSDSTAEGFKQTVDVSFASAVDGDILRILATETDGKVNAVWESTLDEPAEDGYYLVSSKGDYKYAAGTKMSTEGLNEGNDAELYSYSATSGEAIKVRYFNASEGKDAWSYSGNTSSELGAPDADLNYVLAKDAVIDIYAKWEETSTDVWEIKFYVTEHVERYEYEILFQLFEGAEFEAGESGVTQYAYAGSEFTPSAVSRDGYVFRGFFTDSDCTVEYVAAEPTANATIYAKFTKVGFYLLKAASEYSIDGAELMITEGIASTNKAEISVTVAAANEKYSVCYYNADGTMSGHDGLGAEYDFAVMDEGNVKFTAVGTYAIYWSNSDNKLYLNAGITAFETNFLTETGSVCKADNSTDLDALKAVWADLAVAYGSLSVDEKAQFEALTIDSGNAEGELIEQVIARYSYIVKKYGTNNCADFIWGNTYAASASNGFNLFNNNNNVLMIALVASAIVAVSAVGVYFIIRRRRLVK